MTPQEVFNKTYEHLINQGEPSINPADLHISGRPKCMYRQPKGAKVLKCAVGFWIDDDKYKTQMEGSVYTLPSYKSPYQTSFQRLPMKTASC